MSDQKKWFKVWATILIDPHHADLNLEEVGRWTRLGALIASVGENGSVTVKPPYRNLLSLMQCETIENFLECCKKLPNIEVKNHDGTISVTMLKWRFYQDDSTAKERMKTLRAKRRGEEKKEKAVKAVDVKDVKDVSGISKFSSNGKTAQEMKKINDQEFEKLLATVKANPRLAPRSVVKKNSAGENDDDEPLPVPDMTDAPSSKPRQMETEF